MKGLVALLMLGMWGAGLAQAQTNAEGQPAASPQAGAPSAASAPAAAAGGDTQMLREILTELRGIHNDVRLGQTTQILLTEMEVQRGVVDKAQEKRDNARQRVSSLQLNEKNFAAQEAQLEQNASSTVDPTQQKQIAQQEQMFKMNIANFKNQEADAANALADAESTLRREQDVLDGIQAQLDGVVRKLQPAN